LDSDSPATGIILTVIVLGIVFYNKKDEFASGFKLVHLFYILGGIVALGVIILASILIYKYNKKKKRELESERTYLENMRGAIFSQLKINLFNYSSEIALKKVNEIKEEIKIYPKNILAQCNVQEYYAAWDKQIEDIKENEMLEEQKRLDQLMEQRLEKERLEQKAQELFEFKKKHRSEDVIPINCQYSEEVIRKAEDLFNSYIVKQKHLRVVREEAIEFYSKNSLESKPRLNDYKEKVYAKVREEIQRGLIIIKKIPKIAEEITIKGNFFRAKDLDEETKKRALEEGFIHVRGIELDGKLCGGGFYIRKDSNESDYHFAMKHLFAELSKCSKIEYSIHGKRVDVAILQNNLKLGIEIETGTNNSEQLAAKIQWLNENFTHWIFVCARHDLEKFNSMVDEKKSFCLTAKAAMEKVLQLLSIAATG